MNLFGVYVLCENPIVLLGADAGNTVVQEFAASNPLHIHYLRILCWSHRRLRHVLGSAYRFRKRSGVTTHHLCNEQIEYRRFRMAGLRSLWCNHNAFLQEKIFSLQLSLEKSHHAVYTAKVWPYKRIGLACNVRSLRFVTDTASKWHDRIAQQGCGHATVNEKRLAKAEVAIALNESFCGLALSAEEGAMFACTEYLLCGLPVVSTPSIGGRDVWLDNYNSIIVEPTPEAVATAVASLVAEGRDPDRIRHGTLDRMQKFRQTLVEYVNNRIAKSSVVAVDELFGDGMGMASRFVDNKSIPELLGSYRNGRFEARHLIGR